MLNILALVPARGGSKRLPGKNIRLLGGKPLIVWSIEVAARAVGSPSDVIVSTDDEKIGETARQAGARVPWLRPSHLATDTATSVDVSLHALDWFESECGSVDALLLLQPTSPFRKIKTVKQGIEMFRENGRRPVVGVSPAESHPYWCFRIDGSSMQPFCIHQGSDLCSQDLPMAYVVNGAFYIISPMVLRSKRTFIPKGTIPLVMDSPEESIDIDTPWDWLIAESFLLHRKKKLSDSL